MRAVLLLTLLLPACVPSTRSPYFTLIDQQTFRGAPVPPAAGDVKTLPALPLAVVRFDQPDELIAQQLAIAIEAAQSRKPDVQFNVMAPVAHGKAPGKQATDDATQVARMLAQQSVNPDNIHVGIVEDPGTPPREVLVYVR